MIWSAAAEVAAAYDAVAGEYDSAYSQKKSLAENAIVLARVRQIVRKWHHVEDLGCGTGFLLDHVRIDPDRYHGIDISPGMIDRARAKNPKHRFQVGAMEALTEIESESVDVALSLFGSFSYAEPEATVSELHRVLKQRGRFLVMLLGCRYVSRETYILNRANVEVPKRLYSAAEARRLFHRFSEVQVRGLSCMVDALPERLPQQFFDRYLRAEHATLGRFLPDQNFFLVVTGRKPTWERGSSA